MRTSRIAFLMGLGAAVAAGPADAAPFQLGDLIASVGAGNVHQYRSDRSDLGTIFTGNNSLETTGTCFDANNRMFVTSFTTSQVPRMSAAGSWDANVPGPFSFHP